MKKTNPTLLTLLLTLTSACSTPDQSPISSKIPQIQQPQTSPNFNHTHHANLTTDLEFIEQMIPHHQEAIDTSNILLTKTENPEIQNFLNQVIKLQQSEIDQMKTIYK